MAIKSVGLRALASVQNKRRTTADNLYSWQFWQTIKKAQKGGESEKH